jgi:hypothetical protein
VPCALQAQGVCCSVHLTQREIAPSLYPESAGNAAAVCVPPLRDRSLPCALQAQGAALKISLQRACLLAALRKWGFCSPPSTSPAAPFLCLAAPEGAPGPVRCKRIISSDLGILPARPC